MSPSNAGLIVSIYFGYHDSNVAIASQERVLIHLEAERVLGEKHVSATAEQMDRVLGTALEYVGATPDDIGEILVARWISRYDLSVPIRVCLRRITPVITGHHANHIGTAMPSGFDQCLVLCADGGSEDGASSMYLYDHGRLDRIAVLDNTFVTGRVYGTAAQMTVQPDFMMAHASDTGKMMGLSAYGKYDADLAKRLWEMLPEVNRMHPEGVDNLRRHFGLSDVYERMPDQPRCDFAATVQREWEEELLRVTANFRHLSPRLAIVGGCAMNVVANGRLANAGIFEEVFIPAMPTDSGQSVGAIWLRHRHLAITSPFLGRHFGIEATTASVLPIVDDLCAGRVVAVYSGAAESGPRALGHRSILALPSSDDVRVHVSENIKSREPYRPIAPIVREEDLPRFYEGKQPSPYMSYAYQAKDEVVTGAPAIVHVDGTSRVQTVTAQQESLIYDVLTALDHRGVLPIVANTSMNVAGKPMVDTPQDARTFLDTTPVDVLYLGDERLERA
ncbi:MAG: carbamoyltransferase C-terminal domain-containing protein [Pseudonocardiaceae bacterium]